MTKHGALKLKRNNKIKTLKTLFISCGIIFAALTGCKTVPQGSRLPVSTFDTLDDQAAMYIRIPADENRELIEKVIVSFYKGMSESDAKILSSRLNTVYASFGSPKDKKRIQLACDGDIPSGMVSLIKKNGFSENTYSAASLADMSTGYRYYEGNGIQFSFPSSTQVLVSQNVKPMLDLYNKEDEALNNVDFDSDFRGDWKATDLYQWISKPVPSIHFYIVRPQAFLTNLIGTDVSSKVFKLVYAQGNFTKLPNQKYELTLDLEFIDSRFVKPATSMLILALGLTDSEIKTISPTHIQLTGVHLSSKQLVKMLGI